MSEAQAPTLDVNSPRYTVVFATVVCLVCAALVATTAVLLKPMQEANARLYMEKNVLLAADLAQPGESLGIAEVNAIFERAIERRLVDLRSGEIVAADPGTVRGYDQRAARNDPASSYPAPPNEAGVQRLPEQVLAYFVVRDGELRQVVLPVEGLGMWGTMYGFIAFAADGNTVTGLTFYEHRETPGLGGEIANADWQQLWEGRLAYDAQGRPSLEVIKGQAGPPAEDPFRVDGISGATVTSVAVSQMMRFWLSEAGYAEFLRRFRHGELEGEIL